MSAQHAWFVRLILTSLALTLGCAGRDAKTQLVIDWANKAGFEGSTGAFDFKVGDVQPLNWHEWVAEGRSIPGAEEILLRLLKKKDDRLHVLLTVQALGVVGSARCIPALEEIANDPGNADNMLETFAVVALGDLGLADCVAPLANRLLCSSRRGNRELAARGLARIRDPRIVSILSSALDEKRDENARELDTLSRCLQEAKKVRDGSI